MKIVNRKIIMLAILFLTFCNIAFAEENTLDSTTYTENKLGIVVDAKHPEFTIKLVSNPTTGYSWSLREYDKKLLKLRHHEFQKPKNTKLVGAPGYEVWTFRAKSSVFDLPEQTIIKLAYARRWEAKNPAKEIVFVVSFEGKDDF